MSLEHNPGTPRPEINPFLSRYTAEEQQLITGYATRLVSTLEGKRSDLALTERDLQNFGGIGVAMYEFDTTEGPDRTFFIEGIGVALEDPVVDQNTKAQVVQVFVNAYGLTQLHPNIERLMAQGVTEEALQREVDNYFAMREVSRRLNQPE